MRYFVWNFKGYLWNSTQSILCIQWNVILIQSCNIKSAYVQVLTTLPTSGHQCLYCINWLDEFTNNPPWPLLIYINMCIENYLINIDNNFRSYNIRENILNSRRIVHSGLLPFAVACSSTLFIAFLSTMCSYHMIKWQFRIRAIAHMNKLAMRRPWQ